MQSKLLHASVTKSYCTPASAMTWHQGGAHRAYSQDVACVAMSSVTRFQATKTTLSVTTARCDCRKVPTKSCLCHGREASSLPHGIASGAGTHVVLPPVPPPTRPLSFKRSFKKTEPPQTAFLGHMEWCLTAIEIPVPCLRNNRAKQLRLADATQT